MLGLHDLKYKANILHRDVSVKNIMYEVRDGEPFFILSDHDLFSLSKPNGEDAQPSSKHRTGTLPFMSCEILSDLGSLNRGDRPFIPHMLRYDFESLYWVSLWCTMAMETVEDANLKQAIRTELGGWETGSFKDIACGKKDVILTRKVFNELPMTPLYQQCRSWLTRWTNVLRAANYHLNSYDEDTSINFETIDGMITKDTISEAIN